MYTPGHEWINTQIDYFRSIRLLPPDQGTIMLSVSCPGVFEALRAYARDSDRLHFPAWQEYYEDGTKDDAAVGIWHETYVVGPDEYETVYNNMPPYGLGESDGTEIVPADNQRNTAAGRLGHTDGSDSPLEKD